MPPESQLQRPGWGCRGPQDLSACPSPTQSAFSQPGVLGFVGCRKKPQTSHKLVLAGSLGDHNVGGPISPHGPEEASKVGSWKLLIAEPRFNYRIGL